MSKYLGVSDLNTFQLFEGVFYSKLQHCNKLFTPWHTHLLFPPQVWNADTGSCNFVLQGHTSTVRCMSMHGSIGK